MRVLSIAVLCLASGLAAADTNQTVQVYTLDVKERMQNLELINVTAEKPVSEDADPLDESLQAILDEAELLETEEDSSES
jgi:hypothetical protein